MARVGLLGGTFNPPHIAHLVCAAQARCALGLDVVWLVPAADPPHKEVASDPGIGIRIELCRLACAGEEAIEVSTVEADRAGPSYTVDTLRALHDDAPEHELTFIMGADMALSLPTWRDPEGILELARVAVAARDGVARDDVLAGLAGLRGAPERIGFFDMPRLDVSSSLVRSMVAAGRPVRHLVTTAVADRIESLGLYRVGESAWA